jgi:hypothetical protein
LNNIASFEIFFLATLDFGEDTKKLYIGGTAGAEVAPCSYLPFWEGVNRLGGGGWA